MKRERGDEPKPDFFRIDQNRLDQEWLRQSQLYYEHALLLADAKEALERAKSNRDIVAAEEAREIRLRPEHYGLPDKPSIPMVEGAVLEQGAYQKANEKVIQAQHDAAVAQAAVDALDHRKRALQDLVQLRLANYFSEPRLKGEGAARFQQDGVDRAVGKAKKRRGS